ncbi:MAG: biopolymer transporter ExbD [Xanthomonadaceae bacterium]|nr:biopolymer transporter ExbD [Xanthomonadaceae bacterium]
MRDAAATFDDADDEARPQGRRARRLRRQLRLQRDDELNIVSMIDVFAVLMFFLLVTSSISAARLNVLALDLPARAAQADAAPARRPSIRLLETALLADIGDGRVQRLDVTDAPRLAALLLRARQRAPRQDGIDLLVAPDVAYDRVVAVIDAMRAVTPQAIAAGFPGELFPKLAIGEAVAEGARR